MINVEVNKLVELAEKQKSLDCLCYEKAGIKEYDNNVKYLCLAVELGELANEVQVWKYWKANKNIDKSKIKKEFADCLHFALSNLNHFTKAQDGESGKRRRVRLIKMALEEYEYFKTFMVSKEEKDEFLIEELTGAFRHVNNGFSYKSLEHLLNIGHLLDMTFDDMVEAYNEVYADNLMRVQGDY